MKKLTLLALGLLALSFSSCDSGSDEPVTNGSAEVVATNTYSISGTVTGATATITLYKGTTVVNTVTSASTFNFTGLEKTAYTVKITSNGYVDQSVNVTLTDDNSDAIITAALVKKSTETKAVTEVVAQPSAVTVTNDDPSKTATGATTAIVVPASTTISNPSEIASTATFSVTPFVPASTTTDAPTTTGTITQSAPVMSLACEPSGAKFSQPVTLTVDLGENAIDASYMKLISGSESKAVSLSGTTYSGQVDHFSTWTFELNPTIITSDELSTTTSKSISLNEGSHSIAYNSLIGYEVVSTSISSKILQAFIQTHFGATVKTINKTATANITGNGTLSYDIIQKYRTVTIKLGNTTVATIKIYIGATFGNYSFKLSIHSGGSGN
jgi:hypothetical protein